MSSMKKMMLGAVLAAGTMAVTAVPAHAAHIGVYVGLGAPAAYMPPAPGPGYAWVNGYWAGGYWTPGYWNYVGAGYGPAYGYYGYRHDDDDWGRGRDWNRDGYRHDGDDWGRGRDGYRGGDRGRDGFRGHDDGHFRR
jgi:hypothetical protein